MTRAEIEALLIARALLDPSIIDGVELERLSPAALKLVLGVAIAPAAAGAAGALAVVDPSGDPTQDAFVVRLVRRVEALPLMDITFSPPATLLTAVNDLPVLHHDRATLMEQYRRAVDAREWANEILARRRARRTA